MTDHAWQPAILRNGPALRCTRCPVIWWPDRREPKSVCKATA